MTLVFFPRDAIEVLFENPFSPGKSVAPAHALIIAGLAYCRRTLFAHKLLSLAYFWNRTTHRQ